jgi:hypothetical protein
VDEKQHYPPFPFIALTRQWIEIWQQTAALYRAGLASAALFYDTRPLRSLWLKGLTQTIDQYMRTPAFLELTGYVLRGVTRPPRFGFPFSFR